MMYAAFSDTSIASGEEHIAQLSVARPATIRLGLLFEAPFLLFVQAKLAKGAGAV